VASTVFRASGITLICLVVWAQTGGKPLAFEVASIKPSNPDDRDRGSTILTKGGEGLNVANSTVRNLITFAYDIRGDQLAGAQDGSRRTDMTSLQGQPAMTRLLAPPN
jgi:hypothetical protein